MDDARYTSRLFTPRTRLQYEHGSGDCEVTTTIVLADSNGHMNPSHVSSRFSHSQLSAAQEMRLPH
jgi:hypothetical protein